MKLKQIVTLMLLVIWMLPVEARLFSRTSADDATSPNNCYLAGVQRPGTVLWNGRCYQTPTCADGYVFSKVYGQCVQTDDYPY